MDAPECENFSFSTQESFQTLQEHYREYPIVLYTGAGVSRPSAGGAKPVYGLAGWDELMRVIFRRYRTATKQDRAEFEDKIKGEWRNNPWEAADWVHDQMGEGPFRHALVKYIQRPENLPERRGRREYAQLSGRFLRRAPTLNAICAFCARLQAVADGIEKDSPSRTYRVAPNPRVHAILTTNYDPFLEAASSTMYIRPRLKPVGRTGSSIGELHQIPVFHIHGYVNYPKAHRPKQGVRIPPLVDPVLTSRDYAEARPDKPFSFTRSTEIHLLRHYRVLFVGFSFRDEWVNEGLRYLNRERAQRGKKRPYHYALIEKSEIVKMQVEKGGDFYDKLGVKPIALDCYRQIPLVLKLLYLDGLRHNLGADVIRLPIVPKKRKPAAGTNQPATPKTSGRRLGRSMAIRVDQYWDHLYRCRNCSVRSCGGR